MKKKILLPLYVIIFFIVLLLIQGLASSLGSAVADLFSYKTIDPNNLFARLSIHHIIQMLIAIILIIIVSIKFKVDFGFKPGAVKKGVLYVTVFSIAISVIVIIQNIYWYSNNPFISYNYPLNSRNIIGSLAFQMFMSGPSEEILFRALPIALFILMFKKSINNRLCTSLGIIVAALLFSIAHFDTFSIYPFRISKIDFQIYYSFVLGIIFGFTYIKTGSVLYPMLMHSISNVSAVGIGYLFYFLY